MQIIRNVVLLLLPIVVGFSQAFDVSISRATEVLLSDFNADPFSYTYGGFVQSSGPQTTHITDTTDGWGAGVEVESHDFSSLTDARIVVDIIPGSANQVDFFQVNLVDSNNLSARWKVNVGELDPGTPVSLTSLNTLSNPDAVYDGNSGQFVDVLPDLSSIVNWQIEGQWGSPGPFDIEFDNLKVSNTAAAPAPYVGYEPDAPWRAEAVTRIDRNRKADLRVQVRTTAGVPVTGAHVTVEMVEHEYGFGSAMSGVRLTSTSPANIAYQQKAAELFNTGTFFNDLKWPPWEGNWGSNFSQQISLDALDWAASNGMTMRGHVMVWPSYSHLPQSMRARLDEYHDFSTSQTRKAELDSEMRQAVLDHIADIGMATEGKLVDWDVINEIRDNHELMDIFGDSVMIDWFNAARAANPSAKLYLNEFNILASSGNTDSSAHQSLFDSVSYLLDNGAAIDGLGFQSHFDDSRLTGPEKLWQILDRFAAFDLDVKITEFTYSSEDHALREQFTRDFLTAIFAHDATDSFITWGSSILDAAADSNAEILPVDQAILDLVFDEWWTNESLATDANGEVIERVFRGLHDITVDLQGQTWTTQQMISADGLDWIVVIPDAADFDGDGDVDHDDLTHPALGWQVRYGLDLAGPEFLLWQTQLSESLARPHAAGTVPEPHATSIILALLGMSFVAMHRGIDPIRS